MPNTHLQFRILQATEYDTMAYYMYMRVYFLFLVTQEIGLLQYAPHDTQENRKILVSPYTINNL